jgi:UDP-N-acetylglucosamine 2-epimerase (non-hydrolysing)
MLCEVLDGIRQASRELNIDIIFPIHPRTRQAFADLGIDPQERLGTSAALLSPVGMIDSLSYIANARVVVTDSGCIQEEACILNTPCVTVRKNTERPETVRVGANILSECSKMEIVDNVLRASEITPAWTHPYGNGSSARNAVEIVMANYNSIRNY